MTFSLRSTIMSTKSKIANLRNVSLLKQNNPGLNKASVINKFRSLSSIPIASIDGGKTSYKINKFRSLSSIPMSSIDSRRMTSPSKALDEKEAEDSMSALSNRFILTGEVAISKIFPAGFGWQLFATQASLMGLQGSDVSFALMTGAGDFVGVLLGHNIYYTIKKMTGNTKKFTIIIPQTRSLPNSLIRSNDR